MHADDLVVALVALMLVMAFAIGMAWRVGLAVQRQRRVELAWRERLAVWSARAEGRLPRR